MTTPPTFLPAGATKVTATFRDYEGHDRTTGFYVSYLAKLGHTTGGTGDVTLKAAADPIVTALAAISNAQCIKTTFSQEYGFAGNTGDNVDYPSAEQKAVLIWVNTTYGDRLQIEVPAPILSGNFLPDNNTIDPTAIAAITTAINNAGSVSSKDGLSGTFVYERGYLLSKAAKPPRAPGWPNEQGAD
jgi:hypothetical protein